MSIPKIVVVCGPTATGKTRLGIELAKQYDGEIVSAAFTATERDGVLIVTLRAECEQEIGVSRAISPEEMQQLQAQTEEGTTADD